MKEDNLPEGWAFASLEQVCALVTDGTHRSPPNARTGAYRYVTAKNIRPWGLDLSDITYVTEEVHREIFARCPAEFGDVLYIKDGATTGLAAINTIEEPISLLSSVALLKPLRGIVDPGYIKHWLNSPAVVRELTDGMTGSAIKRLILRQIRAAHIKLAPLAEQRRIVDRVEELLAHVNAARHHLAKVPPILRKFRQSVLAAACSGALTEDCRLAMDSESEIAAGDDSDLPEIWNVSPLASLTTKIGSGATPRGGSEVYVSSGVPLIRSQNIHFDGFRDEGLAWLTAEQAKGLESVTVRECDVLLNITGASIGRVCLAPARMDGARVNQHVAIIRARREAIEPSFLALVLASPAVQARINSEEYGVTRQALTKAWISALDVQLPPTSEQKAIIDRASGLFTVARNIEHRVSAAAAGADKLTRSILAKAFKGELVPAESELARAEGRDYETADDLLAGTARQRASGQATQNAMLNRVRTL